MIKQLSATLILVGSVLFAVLFLSNKNNDGLPSMQEHRSLRLESSFMDPKSILSKYQPAEVESYLVDNSVKLGFASVGNDNPSGCDMWKTPTATHPDVYEALTSYATDLDAYNEAVCNFTPLDIDILNEIRRDKNCNVCSALKLHLDGFPAINYRTHDRRGMSNRSRRRSDHTNSAGIDVGRI